MNKNIDIGNYVYKFLDYLLYHDYPGSEENQFTPLDINYSTSAAGEILIEIQDENGKPIPGYTLKESQTLIGNQIARIVSWKGNENVEKLASKPIRLHLYVKDADLYSIRFK